MLNEKYLVHVRLCTENYYIEDGVDIVLSEAKKGLSEFSVFLLTL